MFASALSQCLAKAAFCKAPQKDKFYLFFWRPSGGLIRMISAGTKIFFSESIAYFKISSTFALENNCGM